MHGIPLWFNFVHAPGRQLVAIPGWRPPTARRFRAFRASVVNMLFRIAAFDGQSLRLLEEAGVLGKNALFGFEVRFKRPEAFIMSAAEHDSVAARKHL